MTYPKLFSDVKYILSLYGGLEKTRSEISFNSNSILNSHQNDLEDL